MTRGRHSNEAFVVVEGEQTPIDVLAQALARDWIDEPAIARRAELQRGAPGGDARDRSAGMPLALSELRELLERQHAITQALSSAERRVGTYGDQIARDTARHEELVGQMVAAEARRDQALQIIDDYDHPIQRRFHRSELEQAQVILRQTERAIQGQTKELAEIDERLRGLRSSLRQAQETLRDRPALDRERHEIGRELQRDLTARKSLLGANPPERFVGWLGPRPERGSAQRWDDAAARIDQHRTAFEITSDRSVLGSTVRSWEPSAFAASQREAIAATERLDRGIAPAHVLERPGLELGIGM
ncbi:MAG: hypothetical protein ACR2KK_07640 [Acidimicrobiales bacterium]